MRYAAVGCWAYFPSHQMHHMVHPLVMHPLMLPVCACAVRWLSFVFALNQGVDTAMLLANIVAADPFIQRRGCGRGVRATRSR